jgi:hypothetical protein
MVSRRFTSQLCQVWCGTVWTLNALLLNCIHTTEFPQGSADVAVFECQDFHCITPLADQWSSMKSSLLQQAAVVLFSLSSIFMLILNRQGKARSWRNSSSPPAAHSSAMWCGALSHTLLPQPSNRIVSRSCLSVDAMYVTCTCAHVDASRVPH